MSTTGRRIPVRQESVSNRMTPEMCKAIRRQEKNAGFDYWKAGFPGLGSTGTPADRRPGLQNLSQINLTFPGLFLPNVDGAINKPRRRDSIAGLPVPASSAPTLTLRRSNSMISSVPSSRRIPVQTVPSSNKTSKRDLTCSQLTDSLLSYTNASFPNIGLFRSTTNRPRASDYLWEDLTPESEGLSQNEQNTDDDDDDDDVPTYHTMLADDCEEFSEIETVKSPVELNHIYNPTFPVPNRKPYKSILKNSSSSDSALPGRNLNGPQSAKMPTVCSYQLPSPRSGAVSSATLYRPSGNVVTFRPRMHNGYMYNSVRRQQSASARVVPVDCDNHLADIVSDVTTRKRCVRFNVAHQIHEYRPFDPIINC